MVYVHDSIITSYHVNIQKKYIELEISNYKTNKISIILFKDVLTHVFENIMTGSIILDIEQFDVDYFIEENKNILDSKKDYCWPIDYTNLDELRKILNNQKYKYFTIDSSYGLQGWILAKDIILH